MAMIDSLKPSITELPRDEGLSLILAIRESRRHCPAKRARKKPGKVQRYSAKQLTNHLSKEDMLSILESMGEI